MGRVLQDQGRPAGSGASGRIRTSRVIRGVAQDQKVSMAPLASESRMPQLINSSVRSVGDLS